MNVSAVAARLAAGTLVVGVAVTGCGSGKSSNPSSSAPAASSSTSTSAAQPSSATTSSSSPAAQPGDFSGLLIRAHRHRRAERHLHPGANAAGSQPGGRRRRVHESGRLPAKSTTRSMSIQTPPRRVRRSTGWRQV